MGGFGFFDDPWGTWNGTTATSTTTTGIWTYWTDQTQFTSTASTNNQIFRIWTQTNATSTWTSGSYGHGQSAQRVQPYRQSPQEAAAARRREEEYRERQKVEAARYSAAKARAEGLLYEHLTDEQRAEIKREKFFVVRGGKTGRSYRINANGGLVANVHEIDEAGAVRRRLCAHISHAANAPIFDHLLAQKLMLEFQEEEFLRVANDHGR